MKTEIPAVEGSETVAVFLHGEVVRMFLEKYRPIEIVDEHKAFAAIK